MECFSDFKGHEFDEIDRAKDGQILSKGCKSGPKLVLKVGLNAFFGVLVGGIPDLLDCPEELTIVKVN